jgi:hypothetical protein
MAPAQEALGFGAVEEPGVAPEVAVDPGAREEPLGQLAVRSRPHAVGNGDEEDPVPLKPALEPEQAGAYRGPVVVWAHNCRTVSRWVLP